MKGKCGGKSRTETDTPTALTQRQTGRQRKKHQEDIEHRPTNTGNQSNIMSDSPSKVQLKISPLPHSPVQTNKERNLRVSGGLMENAS